MLLVFGIADGGKHVLVTSHAAAVLRRAGPLPGQTFNSLKFSRSRGSFLNPYLVRPAIPHVILVDEFGTGFRRDILQNNLALVLDFV